MKQSGSNTMAENGSKKRSRQQSSRVLNPDNVAEPAISAHQRRDRSSASIQSPAAALDHSNLPATSSTLTTATTTPGNASNEDDDTAGDDN
jgi:hypothetical protein